MSHELDPDTYYQVQTLFEARANAREWNKIADKIKADVAEALGDGDVVGLWRGEEVVRRVPEQWTYFDKTRFRDEMPDVFDRYAEQRTRYKIDAV